MEGFKFENIGEVHILRVDPGEDLLLSLSQYLQEKAIAQGVILGGYGTLASYHLHWVVDGKIPSRNEFRKGDGGFEILSLNGLITEGTPHLHASLATIEGAFGGHVEEGCRAYKLCEVYFSTVRGRTLTRKTHMVDIAGMGAGEVSVLTVS